MAKISLNNVASGYNRSKINQNFVDLQAELQGKVLYRNNPTGEPNQMESDIDMNSKDIANAKDIYTQRVKVNGKWITVTEEASARDADTVTYDNTTSGLAATEVQAAVDEVEGRVDTAEADITTVEGRLNNVGSESVTTSTGTQTLAVALDDRLIAQTSGDTAGTAALADLTTSPTDTTAGRVLKVGAGYQQLDSSLYHTGNILDPVSQSGGVPTGGIIQRGSTTANNSYTKYADGTAIVTFKAGFPGSGVRTQTANFTFPISFIDTNYRVSTSPTAFTDVIDIHGVSSNRLTSSIDLYVDVNSSGAGNVDLDVIIIGRWF